MLISHLSFYFSFLNYALIFVLGIPTLPILFYLFVSHYIVNQLYCFRIFFFKLDKIFIYIFSYTSSFGQIKIT